MKKTIRLEGRAQEISELVEDSGQRVEALHVKLGLEPDACCHLDIAYAAEHGMIFARTGGGLH